MAELNLAYKRGDQAAIEKIIEDFGQDPEAITGEDVASRIVKTIRRISQLRRRLIELQNEMENQINSEVFRLKETVEKAEKVGGDPLDDLAKKLRSEIATREAKLRASGAVAPGGYMGAGCAHNQRRCAEFGAHLGLKRRARAVGRIQPRTAGSTFCGYDQRAWSSRVRFRRKRRAVTR